MDTEIRKNPESRKKKNRFNIIDFMLVVFIALAVSALVYIVLGNNPFARGEDVEILYTIELRRVRNEFLPQINTLPGTVLMDTVRKDELGTVVGVRIFDAEENQTDRTTGVVRRVTFPEHSRVAITVKATAKKDTRYTVNGALIMVGVPVNFRTNDFVSQGMCVNIAYPGDGAANPEE
jgi:hypothetical protein